MKKTKLLKLISIVTLAAAGLLGTANLYQSKNKKMNVESNAGANDRYIAGSFNGWNTSSHSLTQNSSGTAWAISKSFSAGEEFKITNNSGTWWGAGNKSGDTADASKFSGNDNIICNTSGTYTVIINTSDEIFIYAGELSYHSGKVGWVVAFNNSGVSSFSVSSAIKMDNGSDGNVAQKSSISMNAGAKFQVAYSDGYGFTTSGWKTGSATSGFTKTGDIFVCTNAGNVDVYLNSNYEMYCVYHAYSTTVILDKQSGSAGTSSVTANYEEAMPKIDVPRRDGFTFQGYYTGTNGSGTKYYNDDGTSARNWDFTDSTKTLYAYWTVKVYTITYDRNLNSGLQATQSKTHGVNTNAYSVSSLITEDSRWNPSFAKRFMSWNTSYTGGGVTYIENATISANASFYLYYIEDWYDFRYKVDSGSWIDLVHNDDGMDGTQYQAQFAPSTAQSLPLNGKLYFEYSANGGSSWNSLTSITFAGNYDTTTGIELATIDTIYLQVTKSNTYRCWVPGISDRTIAVFNSSSATTGGTPYTMRGDGDNQTVTTMEVPIEKGQFVRRGYAGEYNLEQYFAGGTGNANSCFQMATGNAAVECLITGVYTVYNKAGEFGSWADLWFTRDEEASAKLLAQKFNATISSICTAVAGGTKSLSDLQDAWGSNSSSTLYNHFTGQFSDTLAYFGKSSSTSDSDILECVERYDYIVKKYGTTALPDFLGRNNGYQAAPQGAKALMTVTKDTNNVIAIVVVSLVSASAIGGFFFYKKRRENI